MTMKMKSMMAEEEEEEEEEGEVSPTNHDETSPVPVSFLLWPASREDEWIEWRTIPRERRLVPPRWRE